MRKTAAVQEFPSIPRRALVYEADVGSGCSLAAMLRKAGYEVLTTAHFEPVLKALEGSHPQELLVVDIITPPGHVNGLAMARMARMKCPA